VLGDLGRDEADAQHVAIAFLAREAEVRGQVLTYDVAVEQRDVPADPLAQHRAQRVGDRGLSCAGQPGEEDGEAPLGERWVAPPQFGGDRWRGEPARQIAAFSKQLSLLGTRDRSHPCASRYLVLRAVGVTVGEVHHPPERHDLQP